MRKDILKNLMANSPASSEPVRPRPSGGAIGAVSSSIAQLKSRSLVEVDPRMVDHGGLQDRLSGDDDGIEALKASISEYGQQVPVMLRPNPNDPERYQVVYGRRRVAALRELGQPVKALVRVLDDRDLIMAQGQENNARRDLSFIEKANFARQMRDAGYETKFIGDALNVDKTVVSRMLKVVDRLPPTLIVAIGAAPGVGRDRWLKLAELLDGRDFTAEAQGRDSDARFQAVLKALTPQPERTESATRVIQSDDGTTLAQVTRRGGKSRLTLDGTTAKGFDDWLIEALPKLHREWLSRSDD